MKIFFSGNYFNIGGPWEVNRNLLKKLKGHVVYLKCKNPLLRLFEILIKITYCDVIIFSSVTSYDKYTVNWAKRLKKKIIFIMHGCLALEYKINNNQTNNQGLENEAILLKNSDLILCVSKMYKSIMSLHYPEYKQKFEILTNCIDWANFTIPQEKVMKNPNRIILIGGGRQTKRNLIVCQAIQSINETYNRKYEVHVFGHYRDYDDSLEISKIPCVSFHSVIPHEQILTEFRKAQLFIQNSDLESFSLGVIEALCCGCDILISKYVGAKDIILEITNNDLILETNNISHIKERIINVLENGNNHRLYNSIDKQETSINYAANKLIRFAQDLYTK